jgi:hypothetical protein
MKRLISCTALALLLASGSAFAAENAAQPNAAQRATEQLSKTEMIGTLPGEAVPISDYYNQSVYDTHDNKIGDVNDLLLDKS